MGRLKILKKDISLEKNQWMEKQDLFKVIIRTFKTNSKDELCSGAKKMSLIVMKPAFLEIDGKKIPTVIWEKNCK